MIYTGYYAKLKQYINAGLTPVSIAGRAPEFYTGAQYKSLAPTYNIFKSWKNGDITNEQYVERFKSEVLDKLDKDGFKRMVNSFDTDIILLCYEKSGDFCHRHIVADWIRNDVGLEVQEFQIV